MATSAELIQELNDDLNAAYSSIMAKGGTVPAEKNSHNLASAISSISGGGEGDPYIVPEFDGGEYDAFAYVSNDGTIKYYYMEGLRDPLQGIIHTASSHSTFQLPNEIISKNSIIAYSFGSERVSLPNYCLMYCSSLRRLYGLRGVIERGNLTSIPASFLSICYAFNQPLDIPDTVTKIGTAFLQSCYIFNQPLPFLENVTSIGTSFLRDCYAFNQPIKLSPQLTTLEDSFMYGCNAFNQPIDVSHITSIGTSFMSQCRAFNQPITLSDQLATIANGFLAGAVSFNQPLVIPQSVTTIGNTFLNGATNFNGALELPENLRSIGTSFLSGVTYFAQPLTLPDTVASIGGYFLYGCNNFTGPLNVGGASGFTADNYTLSATSDSAPAYTQGVTITGKYAEGWMKGLPNRDSLPCRNLILGES